MQWSFFLQALSFQKLHQYVNAPGEQKVMGNKNNSWKKWLLDTGKYREDQELNLLSGDGVNQTLCRLRPKLNLWQNSAVCETCFKVFEKFSATSVEQKGEVSAQIKHKGRYPCVVASL